MNELDSQRHARATNEAIAHHQQGRLKDAQSIYETILKTAPHHFDALHLLGVIALQTNNHQAAADLIGKAITINPSIADAYANRGIALQALNQLDAAVASFDKAITLKPNYAEAYFSRGNALLELGHLGAAIASFDKAISLKPDFAEAYYCRGNALQELGQGVAAIASFETAIRCNPDYAEAYVNRGIALNEIKQRDAAVASFDKAISLKPDLAEAYSNRGNALLALKQLDAAVASHDQAISLKPNLAAAHYNRGNALLELNRPDAALASYDKAITFNSGYAEAYANRGLTLQKLGQVEAAVASFDKAISLQPNYAEAYANRGIALQDLKQLDGAVASFEKAISIRPDYPYLLGTLLHTKMMMCDWENVEGNIAELLSRIDAHAKSSPSFPILNFTSSPSLQRKAAEIWSTDKHPDNPALGPILKRKIKNKIRIGYFSADFYAHATSALMVELLERHDKNKFEIIAFSFGPDQKDDMWRRVSEAFDQFIDVRMKSDEAIAMLSRNLDIDIAIDLKGHTQDSRAGIFSYRAAPIQISYLGYPGTMGASYIDYLMADKTLIPEESQEYYSERIIYLPNSYQVNDRKRAIAATAFNREELGLPAEGFVFCCFNNNYKITPTVFDSWVRILNAVDGSVLWLLHDNPNAEENLRQEAAKRGLDQARLIFAKRMKLPEHLARQRVADLFLDTQPYCAHTSASDALWAGLPVLTCMSDSFASRVAASLLKAVWLPELITETKEDYEALAIALGHDSAKLQKIKDKLAANRLSTPLFDTELFTKNIEDAYTKIYQRYQADLPPDHITIS